MRRIAAVVAIPFVAVVAAACTGGGRADLAGATRSAGTRLPDGFVVAPGTRLLGAVFQSPVVEGQSTWRAVLLVEDRDPIGAYDAYVAQARRMGIPLPGSGARPNGVFGVCTTNFRDRVAQPLDDASRPDALQVACSGYASRTDDRAALTVELSVNWGGTTRHVLIAVTRGPGSPNPQRSDDDGSERITAPKRLPKVHDAPLASRSGAPFGAGNDGYYLGYERPRLVRGSRLAGPAGIGVGGNDFVAVLRVDGDIEAVLTRYVQQLGGGETQLLRGPTASGKQVWYFDTSPDGGGSGEMVADPTGHWIFARTNSD